MSSSAVYSFENSTLTVNVSASKQVHLFTFLKSLLHGQVSEPTIYRWINDYDKAFPGVLSSDKCVSFSNLPKAMLYFAEEKSVSIARFCNQYIWLEECCFDINEETKVIDLVDDNLKKVVCKAKKVTILPSNHVWDMIKLPFPQDAQVRTITINTKPYIDALSSIQAVYGNNRENARFILDSISGELDIQYVRIET